MFRIDAVELERRWLEIGAGKRLHVARVGLGEMPGAIGIEVEKHGGDFQKRIGLRIESAGLDIDDHR